MFSMCQEVLYRRTLPYNIKVDLKNQIKALIKGDLFDDSVTLDKFSRDASLFEVRPELVAAPRDVEDLKALVKFASSQEANISLTARAGGTDMTGGPLNTSIILDFTKYFNQILEVSDDGWARVQPGVWYRDFEKATLARGWLLPSYPGSKDICAVGGMVANNAGGEKTLAYGKTEKYVEQLKVVLSDGNEYLLEPLDKPHLDQKLAQSGLEGEIYRKLWALIQGNWDLIGQARPRVSKNSSGYALWNIWLSQSHIFDLTKLFVGSQGTLGLITEIKFRLIRPQPYSKLLVILLKDFDLLAEVVGRVRQHQPETFESYDEHTLKLGLRYLFFRFAWQFLPEIGMVLSGGLPKLVLVAEFTGDSQEEVTQKAEAARATLQSNEIASHYIKMRVTRTAAEAEKYKTVRRESFNLLRKGVGGLRTAPFIDDIVVQPDQLPEFLPRLNQILKQYENKMTYTIAGHIGDANFHIIPLMDPQRPDFEEIINELAEKVYKLVLEFKGSISGEHNDGLLRTNFLPMMFGDEVYDLFRQVKQIFDPKGIFNPGKKVV